MEMQAERTKAAVMGCDQHLRQTAPWTDLQFHLLRDPAREGQAKAPGVPAIFILSGNFQWLCL